jgi:hypothetical protein
MNTLVFVIAFILTMPLSINVALHETQNLSPNLLPGGFSLYGIVEMADIVENQSGRTDFFQLKSNPNVYLLDFTTLEEQGYTMNRIALLIEASNAPKNRVVNDAEMSVLIAETQQNSATLYHGHDMKLVSLARFFNLANTSDIQLNQYEKKLQQMLLMYGLLKKTSGKFEAEENKALVTVSQLQKDDPATVQDETINQFMRQYIVQHELSHGEYFTNQHYAQYCYEFWKNSLTELQKEAFREYLGNKYYDKNREDLMINEFQAYLIYTGINFGDLFSEGQVKNMSVDELLKLRTQFLTNSNSNLPVIYSD